jgi:amidase
MDVVGPITGCVKDAACLYSVMQDEFDADEIFWSKDALRGKRAGVVVGHVDPEDVRTDSVSILEDVKHALRLAGAEVVEVEIAKEAADVEIIDVLKNELKPGINAYLDSLGDGAPVGSLAEIIAFNEEDMTNRAPYGQAWLERSNATSISDQEEQALVNKKRAAAKAVIAEAMKGVDLLVSLATELTSLYSMAGTPALTIPAGTRASGEPVGATFLAGEEEADVLFASGYAFEQNCKS